MNFRTHDLVTFAGWDPSVALARVQVAWPAMNENDYEAYTLEILDLPFNRSRDTVVEKIYERQKSGGVFKAEELVLVADGLDMILRQLPPVALLRLSESDTP